MPDPVSHGQMMNYLVRNSEDKKRMREYFETNQITTASNMNKPREPKLRQVFEDFNFRNKLADGGRIGLKRGKQPTILTPQMVIDIAEKNPDFTATDIFNKLQKDKTKNYVTSRGTPVNRKVINRTLSQTFDLQAAEKAKVPKGYISSQESFRYKDYEMDIDYDTGKIDIKKTKEAMIPGGDEAGISEEVYMTYKPGMADETTKGGKVVDEYEEFTARPDIDGKMKDVEAGVPDEVIEEGSIGKEQLEEEIVEQIARDKKASGGLAYMLGE